MAIISKQTLGGIVIYESDTYPDFVAEEGDLCVEKLYGTMWMYVGNEWLSLKVPGAADTRISTTTQVWDSITDTVSYPIIGGASSTWSTTFNTTNFTLDTTNGLLRYVGEVPLRVYSEIHMSILNTSRWSVSRVTFGKENQLAGGIPVVSPTLTMAQSIPELTGINVSNYIGRIIDLFNGDAIVTGRNTLEGSISNPAGSRTISLQNATYFTKVIDQGKVDTLLSEDWESGSFLTNGWVTVNGAQTNQWFIGTAAASTGVRSAYISNNSGVSNAYTITAASITHIYVDIVIPVNTSIIVIDFDWRCVGENGTGDDQYDFGRLFWAPTTVTPVAGTAVPVANSIGRIKYNQQANFTSERITISSDTGFITSGTRRLIFSWVNDGSVGTQTPIAIDNIRVRSVKF